MGMQGGVSLVPFLEWNGPRGEVSCRRMIGWSRNLMEIWNDNCLVQLWGHCFLGAPAPVTSTHFMKRYPIIPALKVVLACLALPTSVLLAADEFHPISAISVSTSATDLWPVSNLIQGPGSGFNAEEPYEKLLGGDAGNWVTADPGGFPSDFIEVAGAPVLVIDLGQDVALSDVSVWGYADTNTNGVKTFSLRFATDAEGDAGFGQSITYNPSFEAHNDDANARQRFAFGEAVSARYVEFTAADNFFVAPGDGSGGELAGGDRVGLGEIAFAVPVPPFYPIASITSSTSGEDLWPVSNLIQGPDVGFASDGDNAKLLGADAGNWVTADPGGFPSDYIEVAGAPVLTLDLGKDVSLSEISVWGYANTNANGVSAFSLRFATEAEGTAGFGQSIAYNPTFTATNEDENARQSNTFSETVTARYVEFTATDNFFVAPGDGSGGELAGGDRVGLGEIAFATAAPQVFIPPIEFFPIAAAESSTGASDLWPASNLIQGPGVDFAANEPNEHVAGSDANLWVTADDAGFPSDYIEDVGQPVITLDLGADVSLSEISVWGYSGTNANGVSEYRLRFATEAEGPSGFGQSIAYNPTFTTEFGAGSRQSARFSEWLTARYVEFTALDNFYTEPGDGSNGEAPGGDRVGLAEIAFEIRLDPDGDRMATRDELLNGTDPNVADADSDNDGDGLTAIVEINDIGTRANKADTDEDGLNDNLETNTGVFVDATNTGTDPNVADTDGDKLLDGEEVLSYGTNPLLVDTDGDSFSDGLEVAEGENPLDPNTNIQTLVAYWPLDSDGSSSDGLRVPASDDGVVYGEAGARLFTGESARFDGESAISFDHDGVFNPESFTITLWARSEGGSGGFNSPITSRDEQGIPQSGYVIYDNNNGFWTFWSGSGGGGWQTLNGPEVVLEEWVHLAISYDSSAELKKLYVDGVLVGEQATPVAPTVTTPLTIGGGGDFGAEFRFVGNIDNVALFGVALSDEDVAFIFENGVESYAGLSTRFSITDLVRTPDGVVDLTWESEPGAFYDVEVSGDLAADSWQPLALAITAEPSPARVTSVTVPGAVDEAMQYLRVVRVPAPPLLASGFEDGLGDWTVGVLEGGAGTGTMWGVNTWGDGLPFKGPAAAHTGTSAAVTGDVGDYADGTTIYLRTPVIDPLGFSGRLTLDFWYYLGAVEGEGGQVSLLEADGTLIQALEPLFLGGEDGNTADWTEASIRLPALDPVRPFIVQFGFLSLQDGDPANGPGWFIDDVSVGK